MSKTLTVTITKQTAHLPTGSTFDHSDISVKDASGATFTQSVNGKEVPAWTGVFTIADGAGVGTVTDFDAAGNPIGAAVPFQFDTAAGTYQASVGVTVTIA
jgi:hypothetical protein